jgi:hypothetical protein
METSNIIKVNIQHGLLSRLLIVYELGNDNVVDRSIDLFSISLAGFEKYGLFVNKQVCFFPTTTTHSQAFINQAVFFVFRVLE